MEGNLKAGAYSFHGRSLEFDGSLAFLMALHEVQGLFLPVVPSVRRRLTDVLVAGAEETWITRMESWVAQRNKTRPGPDERTAFAVAAGNAEAQWLNEMLDDETSPIQAVKHTSRDRMKVHRLVRDASERIGGLRGLSPKGCLDAETEGRLVFVCECLVHGLHAAPGGPWPEKGLEEKLGEWALGIASELGRDSGLERPTVVVGPDPAILALAEDDRGLLADLGQLVDRMRGLARIRPRADLWIAGLAQTANILGDGYSRVEDILGEGQPLRWKSGGPDRTAALLNRRRELFEKWAETAGVEYRGPWGGPRKPVVRALVDA